MPPAKNVKALIKLQVPAGQANPAPPVGPALGQHGVNIMDFCNQFNERTKDQTGLMIPVVISVYDDRSISFITKTPPAPVLIKKAEQEEGRQDHKGAVGRDCIAQNAGSERGQHRFRDEHDRGHRAQYGHRSRRLAPAFRF